MKTVDVNNPAHGFPFERHTYSDRALWPHVIYRYPSEEGRRTHLEAERAALVIKR